MCVYTYIYIYIYICMTLNYIGGLSTHAMQAFYCDGGSFIVGEKTIEFPNAKGLLTDNVPTDTDKTVGLWG